MKEGLIYNWQLFHIDCIYKVSLQCEFSSVEQVLSSEQRPFHTPYICVVLLLWGWPFAVLIYLYIEKFLHTLDPGKHPMNCLLQKCALEQIHQSYSWPHLLHSLVEEYAPKDHTLAGRSVTDLWGLQVLLLSKVLLVCSMQWLGPEDIQVELNL